MLKGRVTSILLALVLVAVLALVGCGSPETKVTADEVVQKAVAAQAGMKSSHMEVDIDATLTGTQDGSPMDVSLAGSITSDMDWTNKKAKAHSGISVGYNGLSLTVTSDMYAVDNVGYTQTTMMGTTSDWSKSSLPVDFWADQESQELIDSVLQSTEAKSLPDEKVGNVNCYVLQLTPNIAAIQQGLSQQYPDQGEIPDIASLVKSLSIKVWVAKDTSYVTKAEIILSAHVTSQDIGEPEKSDVLDISVTITMTATEFNGPLSFEVPAEALNAEEGDGFELPTGMFGM